MPRRQPRTLQSINLPIRWLVTDERQGDALLPSIEALPDGSAILFRHYQTSAQERRRLFAAVRQLADRHDHLLILSDTATIARKWRADGVHLTARHKGRVNVVRYADLAGLWVTMTAHDDEEMMWANRLADIIMVAPVYPTASHPQAATLCEAGFAALAAKTEKPVIALGGMTAERFDKLHNNGADGWAAIDGLTIAQSHAEAH